MDQQPQEIFCQILAMVDFLSLVRTTLTCKRWAEQVINLYPTKLEEYLPQMKQVTRMKVYIASPEKYQIMVVSGNQAKDIYDKTQSVEYFSPDELVIENVRELKSDVEIYRRCLDMMPAWWMSHIKKIKCFDFSLTVFQKLAERFSRKEELRMFTQRLPLQNGSVDQMNKILTRSFECDLYMNPKFNPGMDKLVLFNDSSLELLIDLSTQKPMGSLDLDVRSSVSLPVLTRFFQAASAAPLRSSQRRRRISLNISQLYGKKEDLEEFLLMMYGSITDREMLDIDVIDISFGWNKSMFHFKADSIHRV